MRKVFIEEAKAGMVIAADIFDSDFGGGEFPLICRGVELTTSFINKMKDRSLTELLIITPPGYRGLPGEIFTSTEITEDILFEGEVELSCDIPAGTKIVAGENIGIIGNVQPGCSITSAKGDINIKGSVVGSKESRITMNASKRVTIHNEETRPVQFADIKSIEEIVIHGDVKCCALSAKGKLLMRGKVEKTNIYSQTRISLLECGNDLTREPCQLLVKPSECRKLFQEIMILDKQLAALNKDEDKLQNTIDLVKKIGEHIDQVSQEKKARLAADINHFHKVQQKIKDGLFQKKKLHMKVIQVLDITRIIITKIVHPNTKITIENCSLMLDKSAEAVSFHVEDMKVVREAIRK